LDAKITPQGVIIASEFTLMNSALHVDTHVIDQHHAEYWTYGPESRMAWAGLFPSNTPDIGG